MDMQLRAGLRGEVGGGGEGCEYFWLVCECARTSGESSLTPRAVGVVCVLPYCTFIPRHYVNPLRV